MGHIDPGGQNSSTEVEQNYDEEEGVCKAPEQFESKAAQSCPLAEPPPKPKREDCQATSLVISRKKRKIEIKAPSGRARARIDTTPTGRS